jgi:hypothetical protein
LFITCSCRVKDPISATLSFLQILVSITLLIRVIRFSSLFILSLRKNLLLFALSYYISYTTSRCPRVFLIPSPIEFGASDFTKTFASSYIYIYIYIYTHTHARAPKELNHMMLKYLTTLRFYSLERFISLCVPSLSKHL